ncbi:MAG: Lrp/AsnC ligand binding domain-containing protein [Pseudomonadota bacterium]
MATLGVETSTLDQIDMRLLALLNTNGRMPVTELARHLGLSKTPCAARMKRLVEQGYILGFQAVLNPAKLDRSHVAFVEVRLRDTTETALQAFNTAVQDIAEVEQCHMIAGSFDYLLKVRTKDIAAYRRVLGERISALPHVASSSTHVAMEAVKENGV